MAPPRIDGSTSTAACYEPPAPEPTTTGKPSSGPSSCGPAQTTVERFSKQSGFEQSTSAPPPGPTSNPTRFELEQALARQELLEGALGNLTAVLQDAVKFNKGRIDGYTFINDKDQSSLKQALRELPADQVKLAVREAVERAFPKASAGKVNDLVADTMAQLRAVTTDAVAKELKDFIGDTIKTGARHFREAAKDPAKLEAMLNQLSTLSGHEREETLQAWGVPEDLRRPTAQQLATALMARADLMDRSAKGLDDTSGKDTTLFRLASYPGTSELFAQKKKLDPTSVAARSLERAMKDAEAEKSLRAKGDLALAVTSAVAFGAVAAAASLGTLGAVAVAAPATLANTARKAGEEENAVNNARAGAAAGVMASDAIAAAERHRAVVLGAQAVELVAPAAVHVVGHGLSTTGQVVLEGVVAGSIVKSEWAVAHEVGHAHGQPTGKDAVSK